MASDAPDHTAEWEAQCHRSPGARSPEDRGCCRRRGGHRNRAGRSPRSCENAQRQGNGGCGYDLDNCVGHVSTLDRYDLVESASSADQAGALFAIELRMGVSARDVLSGKSRPAAERYRGPRRRSVTRLDFRPRPDFDYCDAWRATATRRNCRTRFCVVRRQAPSRMRRPGSSGHEWLGRSGALFAAPGKGCS